MRHEAPRSSLRSGGSLLAVGAVLLGFGLVARTSFAAFIATTVNPGNHWATASVVLGDDDSNSARFNASGMVPGGASASDSRCVRVTYTGSATADIRLYGSLSQDTGLAQYLTLTIEEGAGGTFADCSGFVAGTTLFDGPATTPAGTLASFAAAHGNWANGVSTWQASGAGSADRTYRLTYTLQDDNGAQGASVDASFTWEAESVPHA